MSDDVGRNGRAADVRIQFILSRAEAVGCYRRLLSRKLSTWAFTGFGVAFAVFGWLVAAPEFVVAGVVFSVLYGGLTFAIQPAAMWRRYPELHDDQIVCLSDHGVRTELTNRHSTAD